jgi:5-methyltetrahydrofolate--homocysteine methyltransferase
LRDHVKIIIAGAPVTDELARRIGVDGFAPDASQAGVVATTLISQ